MDAPTYDIDPNDESPEARLCRVLNIVDALPEPPSDATPLRNVLPGGWPTLGDLRLLAAKHFDPS
jgi:hypothetical protein